MAKIVDFAERLARLEGLRRDAAKIVPSKSPESISRILRNARLGINSPSSLSENDFKEVCFSLVVHYAQMGID